MKYTLIFLFALIILVFSGCKKSDDDPQAPEIEFGGFNYLEVDASGVVQRVDLIVKFKDINGDIGRRESELNDNCGKSINDLFIYYEIFDNGNFKPFLQAVNDTILDANCNIVEIKDTIQFNLNHSVQFVQPEGNNKSIEGEMKYTMNFLSELLGLPAHGRFRIYLVDRAGNKSNEVFTDDFIIR